MQIGPASFAPAKANAFVQKNKNKKKKQETRKEQM